MHEVQPIEDAGPRITVGILRLLRIFVATASPGVLAENPLGDQDRPWILPDC